MAALPPRAGPGLGSGYCGADCGIDKSGLMAARIWRAAVIEKTEEDPATCPIGRQAGDLDKG
jgi:hypothetical protein